MIKNFQVSGSGSEIYDVIFQKNGTKLNAYCTCKAGQNGMHCKHRIRIFDNNMTGIVSGNQSEVSEVSSWVVGSDIEEALRVISNLEVKAATIKKQLSTAKKSLARSMRE